MNKKGVSRIVELVLLILIGIVLVGIIGFFVVGLVKEGGGEIEGVRSCLTDVEIDVIDSCYIPGENGGVKFKIRNNKEVVFTEDNFILRVVKNDGKSYDFPFYYGFRLGFETEEIVVNFNYENVKQVLLIPRINNKNYCYEKAVELELDEC